MTGKYYLGGKEDHKPEAPAKVLRWRFRVVGELLLAGGIVLFPDEFPEFHRRSLEVLRQPLEEGQVGGPKGIFINFSIAKMINTPFLFLILRVARAIARLEGAGDIKAARVIEAIGYRSLYRKLWPR
jgi:hypothetical protein